MGNDGEGLRMMEEVINEDLNGNLNEDLRKDLQEDQKEDIKNVVVTIRRGSTFSLTSLMDGGPWHAKRNARTPGAT